MKKTTKIHAYASLTRSITEIVEDVLEQCGSEGLQTLVVEAMKAMDCNDTFEETKKKINKLH